jgi:hypothetical protein
VSCLFSGGFRNPSTYKAPFKTLSREFSNNWGRVPSQKSKRWCEEERQTWPICIPAPFSQSTQQAVSISKSPPPPPSMRRKMHFHLVHFLFAPTLMTWNRLIFHSYQMLLCEVSNEGSYYFIFSNTLHTFFFKRLWPEIGMYSLFLTRLVVVHGLFGMRLGNITCSRHHHNFQNFIFLLCIRM